VLVVGAAEAGKSTLIRALSPTAVNLAVNGRTVAMDHASLIRGERVLSLVGVPGQPRFQAVREVLAAGARCAVWVHRAGTPRDPATVGLVASLSQRGVPYLVLVNRWAGEGGEADGWSPAPAQAPPHAVLSCDLSSPGGDLDRLVGLIWACADGRSTLDF
jgi:hypothetical protein